MERGRESLMYNKIVLDHFQNPHNLNEMKDPDATGMGASRVCGDIMTIYIKVKDDVVTHASYQARACGAAIAAGSVLTDIIKGKSITEISKINQKSLEVALGGLPKIKLHCPDIALESLNNALKNYAKKK